MKLLNQSIKHLSISVLIIITAWSIVFYFNLTHEIKGSMDEGLENYKRLIILNAQKDSTILTKTYFDESFFKIKRISKEKALFIKDQYLDTLINMQDADDKSLELEPVRMLTTAFKTKKSYYELKIANSMVEEDDLITELMWDAIWLYIFLIGSIIFINNIVLRKLWKPFYNFLDQLKNYRLNNNDSLPNVNTETKEFQDLQLAVNTSLEYSKKTFEKQKEFIGNAAHELQTPLAIAINKLELLLENGNLNDLQAEGIVNIYQIMERLVLLNKSLLLLSKIENKQFIEKEQVNINDFIQQHIDELSEFTTHKKLNISIQEEGNLILQTDPTLASIIIANLLKNAVTHNIINGEIEIIITNNSLEIRNTGRKLALDQENIFNRFQKSNDKPNSTGLGLAIVKAIADIQNYLITYTYKDNLHCFKIKF